MALRILTPDEATEEIRAEILDSQAKLGAHPLTSQHVTAFSDLLTGWSVVDTQERALKDAIVIAQAKIEMADDDLDLLVDAVSAALLVEAFGDRMAAIYIQFFGTKTPSDLKRPILGDELEVVRSWIPWLKAHSSPALKSLGATCEAAVLAADNAVLARTAADDALRAFRFTGERRAFVNNVNAARKAMYGALAQMPHTPEGAGLPPNFADRFVRHEASRRTVSAAKLKKNIKALELELDDLRSKLAAIEAKEAAKESARKAAYTHQQELEEAEKLEAEARAKADAVRAKMGGKKKKK